MDYTPDNQIFRKLKESTLEGYTDINRLKAEREEVVQELGNDKADLQTVDTSIAQLTRELEGRMSVIKEKERKLAELEKTVNETEKSYDIVTLWENADRADHAEAVERLGTLILSPQNPSPQVTVVWIRLNSIVVKLTS